MFQLASITCLVDDLGMAFHLISISIFELVIYS